MTNKKKIGIVVGKFYPLHIGHVNLIQKATTVCDKVIVVVSHHAKRDVALYNNSNMKKELTGKDKLAVVQKTFQNQQDLIIPVLVDETEVPEYPNGWGEWAKEVRKAMGSHIRLNKELPDFSFEDATFIINENADRANYTKYFGSDTLTFDVDRNEFNISATMVRSDPFKYWDFIPRASREYLAPKIAICGGESSGKTIMTDRMANLYATTSVYEKGRTFKDDELGGDESALQYKHYGDIGYGHYQDLKFASTNANKVVFSDTEFVTTQAFSIAYEGKRHPAVQELINTVRMDLTILLSNDTLWVDDGMRVLGSESQRTKFQNLLKELFVENGIEFVEIKSPSYEIRYEVTKLVTETYLKNKISVADLQEIANAKIKELTNQ